MMKREKRVVDRKAETAYTARKKNIAAYERWKNACETRHTDSSFEEQLKRNAAAKACYVYIGGVSMPVLSA